PAGAGLARGAWALPPEETAPPCGQDVAIRNGTFTLSDGYRPGSLLTYACPPGFYPYPLGSRLCQENGRWTPLRTQPLCRGTGGPDTGVLQEGSGGQDSWVLSLALGGAWRLVVSVGELGWAGEHCPNPGVPAGMTKSGSRYRLGERVSYRCQRELALVGSAQRVCTEAGEWSGAEPSCRAPFSYDRVEDIGAEFGASFSNVLGLATTFLGRRLILSDDSFLNVYLLVDSSKSVTRESFQIFKEWVENIVDRELCLSIGSKRLNTSQGSLQWFRAPQCLLWMLQVLVTSYEHCKF
uniref:Sushi domain-containing protein n=1 Tax=Chelydra serpentina TaxID=8475 RepID=A0A8C3S795_CHESE